MRLTQAVVYRRRGDLKAAEDSEPRNRVRGIGFRVKMKLKMEIPVETVVWIDSEHAPGHFNLGLILAGQANLGLDRAAEEFQEAVRLKPD